MKDEIGLKSSKVPRVVYWNDRWDRIVIRHEFLRFLFTSYLTQFKTTRALESLPNEILIQMFTYLPTLKFHFVGRFLPRTDNHYLCVKVLPSIVGRVQSIQLSNGEDTPQQAVGFARGFSSSFVDSFIRSTASNRQPMLVALISFVYVGYWHSFPD